MKTKWKIMVSMLVIGALLINTSCSNEEAKEISEDQQVVDQQVQSTQSSQAATPVNQENSQSKEEKKMSNTAKGALIGAGAGAITGAAVSKKKGKGAVVGGIIGAGTGAIAGKIIDKKKEEDDNQ